MIKQILIVVGILIFTNSCKETKQNKVEESEVTDVVEIKNEKEPIELTTEIDSYFDNDSLTVFFKSQLEKIALDSKFDITRKPIKNRHVDNLMDTIITRTFKNTELISYKAVSEEWIFRAKIRNEEFELNDFVKVGTKKYVLEKSLAKRIANDTLIIGNIEQTSSFHLIFESGVLKLIEYEGYMD